MGPFPSWRDLRKDYGAVGDGKADDTATLQRALDDLIKHEEACVLYIPAGVYRLTDTVKTVRTTHTDCQGVSIIGEDPESTVLRWDGDRTVPCSSGMHGILKSPGSLSTEWDAQE